jgi:hypothetical protein
MADNENQASSGGTVDRTIDRPDIIDDAKSVSPLVEDVETRAKGATQSGVIDDSEIQPRLRNESDSSQGGRTPESPEIETLLNAPLEDRSVIGSGTEADPLKSRGGTQTQTDVR